MASEFAQRHQGNGHRSRPEAEAVSSPGELGDAELLEAVAVGRHGALATLYRRHAGRLFAFALRIVESHTEAEDVLQECFVQIWKRGRWYDPERSAPLTWMIMILRGIAIDRIRADGRRQNLLQRYRQDLAAIELVIETNGQTRAVAGETSAGVAWALNRLPDDQRHPIELAFYRGWTQDEIARATGSPLGTVKARIRRGMMALRRQLKDWYA